MIHEAIVAADDNRLAEELAGLRASIDALVSRMDRQNGRLDKAEARLDRLSDRMSTMEGGQGRISPRTLVAALTAIGSIGGVVVTIVLVAT